ncbi:MAG: sulfite exporter TauE/SafE family protein, partial [Candidatus Rokubacteria bacterium]|nr:sulfite exporter TauE/SafE family protein [Candidatus Rokubacteria bacterium]
MTVSFAVTLIALGFVGAFVSGLVGVGGAIVAIPLLYYVPPLLGVGQLDIKLVSGISMAQVLAATTLGAWTHGRHVEIHRALALGGGAAMAIGALAGAVGSRWVSGRVVLAVFGLMAIIALPLMFVAPARLELGSSTAPVHVHPAIAIGVPGVIGLMSGLVGAGGAFLLMPVLLAVMRLPMRASIGTSLAMTTMSAAVGLAGKLVTGQVPFAPAAAVVLGSLSGAPVGARLSRRAPVRVLRLVLA